MRRQLRNVVAIAALVAAVACSQNAVTVEYQAVGTLEATVATGMNIYFDLVNQGKVTVEKQREVKKAYDIYYSANQAAHIAITAYKAGTGTDPSVKIDAMTAAANALLPILRALGVAV